MLFRNKTQVRSPVRNRTKGKMEIIFHFNKGTIRLVSSHFLP